MSDGVLCPTCGSLMRRTGSCHTCPCCGTTTGCGRYLLIANGWRN